MARTWKIVVGVTVALVLLVTVGLCISGIVVLRSRTSAWGPMVHWRWAERGPLGLYWGPHHGAWGWPALFIVGGLLHLAFLGLLVGLLVALVRRPQAQPPAPQAPAAPADATPEK